MTSGGYDPNQYPPPGGQPYGNQPGGQPYGGQGGQPYGGQPGGYGAPQGDPYGAPQGGYPPPPPLGAQPTGGAGFSVGDALGYGWNKFKANPAPWIIAVLIYFVVTLIFSSPRFFAPDSVAVGLLGQLLASAASIILATALVNGALGEVNGAKPAIGQFFNFPNVAAILITGVLVFVITTVGFILCVIPGIIATFLLWYAYTFVLDQNQQPVDALKSSFNLVKAHVSEFLILALAIVGINIVGAILCGLGLFVTIPVSVIASTYAYRVTVKGPVSPAV